MGQGKAVRIIQSGREITEEDVEHVKEVVRDFVGLSRKELAATICEHWGWVTASGANKEEACGKLLVKLEQQGEIRLPEKQAQFVRGPTKRIEKTPRVAEHREVIEGDLCTVGNVSLKPVVVREEKALWNEDVQRHHYLGYKQPIGFRQRYWIESSRGKLGCILVAGAAISIEVRDRWIGWNRQQRIANLPWVINQWRFLIFPWVQVRHLASHALGQLAKRVCRDWQDRWGYQPVLMETFVDPAQYEGTCYQAAGWTRLGETKGHGKQRKGKTYKTTPKVIYVRPLTRDFREKLCSEQLVGRIYE